MLVSLRAMCCESGIDGFPGMGTGLAGNGVANGCDFIFEESGEGVTGVCRVACIYGFCRFSLFLFYYVKEFSAPVLLSI